jgi:hypothetical protein
MAAVEIKIFDCKVKLRKYVLISRPSRWNQLGDRVVVQSPMIPIPNTAVLVPVKRFCGEKDNSGCFLPRCDIEKDASPIYDRELVSKTVTLVDAHGVALSDSSPDEELEHKEGDKFWIYVGASTIQHQTTVPVISLRTYKTGTIIISNVCWYPKIQGTDQEIWTLGGHPGSRNFSY